MQLGTEDCRTQNVTESPHWTHSLLSATLLLRLAQLPQFVESPSIAKYDSHGDESATNVTVNPSPPAYTTSSDCIESELRNTGHFSEFWVLCPICVKKSKVALWIWVRSATVGLIWALWFSWASIARIYDLRCFVYFSPWWVQRVSSVSRIVEFYSQSTQLIDAEI